MAERTAGDAFDRYLDGITTAAWGRVEIISEGGKGDFAAEGEVDPVLAAVARRYWALGQQRTPEDARERILRRVMTAESTDRPHADEPAVQERRRASMVDDGVRPQPSKQDRDRFRPRWHIALELAAMVALLLGAFGLSRLIDGDSTKRSPGVNMSSNDEDSSVESWSQFRGGAGNEGGLDGATAGPIAVIGGAPEIKWHAPVGSARTAPVVGGGLIYTRAAVGDVVALDEATGQERWRTPLIARQSVDDGQDVVIGSPAVTIVTVYAGALDGMHALDVETGVTRWHAAIEPVISSPVVVDMMVFAAAEGALYALNATTGAVIWRFETGTSLSSPAVSGGSVFVAERIIGAAAAAPGTLFAIDAVSGRERWRFRPPSGELVWSPSAVAGTVYVWGRAADRYTLFALDGADGSVRWQFEQTGVTETAALGWDASPAVAQSTVYITTNQADAARSASSALIALEADTGQERWRVQTAGWLSAAPAVINGVVYVGGGSGNGGVLLAVAAQTGATLWQLAMAGPLGAGAAYANGELVVSVPDGDIYAIGIGS